MKKSIVISVMVLLATAIVALLFLYFSRTREMNEMVEQMEFEKQELEEEYEDLAIQFDGYQYMHIQNDSLQERLAQEQQRVQDLLEELRITKVTNARRIAELKKELATVRAVMVDYVRQIDSLNVTNRRLTEENQQYREENQQVRRQNTELSTINNQLSETVTRASMLELSSCTVTTLNKHDRKTRLVSQIKKLQFDYAIAKNITCEPGLKTLYVRIINPNGELLGEDAARMFFFESEDIPYTLSQEFEYTGEEFAGTVYWALADEVVEGFYNADFFADGNLIGSVPFQIRK
ncbi:MAG: hypothetical protein ACI30A_00580 [Paludibacteraceae bacterium]